MRAISASFNPSISMPLTGPVLPRMAGFFFAFRLVFVLIAVRFFGLEAEVAVAAGLAMNYLMLAVSAFNMHRSSSRVLPVIEAYPPTNFPPIRWVAVYFAMTGISLVWTEAASLAAASAFWCAMAADSAIVFVLLRNRSETSVAANLMQGYVWGASAIAVIAWLLPSQSDLRLGDEVLLGPNQIGFVCAFALFFAQYLIRSKNGNWTVHALLLGVTLLRSLSKTTIIAFLVAQGWILLRDRSISVRAKRILVASTLLIVSAFLRLLFSYSDVYLNAGNQSETLTGRLGIWLYFLSEAVQQPWLGHGFHSVWKIVPPFGPDQFEARHAHNELLQQFYAYGLMGVAVVVAMYTSLHRCFRGVSDLSLRVWLQGFLIFALIRGLADTEAFDLTLPMWAVLLIGGVMAESRYAQEATA
jgi:exopolysaccharide production protein ExoQ